MNRRCICRLAVAFSRSEKMDLIVRQATELGVSRFIAFRSRRSQYSLGAADAAKRKERWLKIARESICQCARAALPEILVVPGVSGIGGNWLGNGNRLKKS